MRCCPSSCIESVNLKHNPSRVVLNGGMTSTKRIADVDYVLDFLRRIQSTPPPHLTVDHQQPPVMISNQAGQAAQAATIVIDESLVDLESELSQAGYSGVFESVQRTRGSSVNGSVGSALQSVSLRSRFNLCRRIIPAFGEYRGPDWIGCCY